MILSDEEFEEKFDKGDFDSAYQDYIMAHASGDRLICNGDMLIEAVEDMYLYEEFKASVMHRS